MKVKKTLTYKETYLFFFEREVKIELIDLDYEEFCVKKTVGTDQSFFLLTRNGTTFETDELIRTLSISDFTRANKQFIALQASIKGDYKLEINK